MVTVELTDEDLELCKQACIKRMEGSAEAGLNHACLMQRTTEQRIEHEIGGAAGELATARFLGLGKFNLLAPYARKAPDIEPDIEVRSTRWMNGHLCIRQRDQFGRRYVLAITALLRDYRLVRLAGWIHGSDAMKEKYLDLSYGTPEWWVPWRDLHPMEMLERPDDAAV